MLVCSSLGAARISIMISQRSDAHIMALESLLQAMDESERMAISTYDLGGQMEAGTEMAREIERSNPDLVLAIGTTAALAAKSELENIPIVFCMVLNPVSSGLVKSMGSPGGNITGASLDIPLKTQFKYIKLMVPNLKSMGVIYNPEETGMVVQEAVKVARRMNLSLIAKAISSEREVPDALGSILNGIDALWSVADGTVFGSQSTQYILLNTLRTETPFMGLSPSFVKAGALMALSCDYGDVGKQAAEIANRVLNGKNPGDIAIAVPRKVSLHINLRTAYCIGLRVPVNVIELADEVIK
jgi:putative ABC transport system substrate-binding protein